jgi:ubiquinone/menaquinone biosynthesis C-methylase UbiE
MLGIRSSEKEQMDNFELSGNELNKTLSGLSIINKYLGNTSATCKAVKIEILKSDKQIKIIDLGCGAGDNLRKIAKWCSKNNKQVELLGIDGNAHVLKYATEKNINNSSINYLKADILNPEFILPTCNILISSHFMYHFSDHEFVEFLKKAKTNITTKIIFSELQRNSFAYSLFKISSALLPFSTIVKQDGLAAIRRSFIKKELVSILEKAQMKEYQITWKWAFRFLISIEIEK